MGNVQAEPDGGIKTKNGKSSGHTDSEEAENSGVKRNSRTRSSLSKKEVQQRIDASPENKVISHAGLKIQYAWVSQRGYYPDDLSKDNQDSYTILPSITKKKKSDNGNSVQYSSQQPNGHHDNIDLAYFAVYDGHGKTGHLCSWFVRDNLPKQIFSRLAKAKKNSAAIQACIWEGHTATNEMLHEDTVVDDSLSGTTSISVILCNRTLYVSNVGDSRAVLLSIPDPKTPSANPKKKKQKESAYIATPLSLDQTPYRKDERERVKKYGARILSMDQLDGAEPIHENWGTLVLGEDIDEGGDPPRIWHPNGDYPGTAFTRSLGDHAAEELGVVADPEILEYEVGSLDKFIVIASDGVWEFLTNQMVADIVALHKYDPLAACKQIVATSYNLWLQYEVRTDDITIIILALEEDTEKIKIDASANVNKNGIPKGYRNGGGSRENSVHSNSSNRINGSSSHLKVDSTIVHTAEPISTHTLNHSTHAIPSTTSSKDINKALQASRRATGNSFIGGTGLSTGDSKSKLSDNIIPGDEVNDNDNDNTKISTETKPVRRTASREKRKNVIQSQESSQVGPEDNEELNIEELTVAKSPADRNTISQYLSKNFLFQHLNASQLNMVVDVMKPVEVKQNDWIIKQGDPGDKFYIICTGKYDVRVLGPNTVVEEKEKGGDVVHVYESNENLHPGFGELSLMYGKPRAASVIAVTDGKLYSLDRRIFRRVALRSPDSRKAIIRALKKVELFKSLTFQQVQRLADLLQEAKYKAGDYIIKQGDIGDFFYLIVSGTCNCTKTDTNSTITPPPEIFLVLRSEYEYFGERALLTSEPRAANVIAKTDVKLLYIGKSAFDEVLGSLADIIDQDRLRRETLANAILEAPKKLEGIELKSVISADNLGPFMLGSFKSPQTPNLTVRTFLLSEIEKLGLSDCAVSFIEISRYVTFSQKSNPLIPRLHSASRDLNAIHLLYREPVITDLSTILTWNSNHNLACDADCQLYITACIISALETLHGMGIIYRSIQPESLYVDLQGRVLLMDYRLSKLTTVGGKTFTVCGATDYLAPEQISQMGHTASVDLWSLGVLLYELNVGSHPFSSTQGEIATYTKIASFGTPDFPELKYPEPVKGKSSILINQLVKANPDARLGAGVGGFAKLKKSTFFDSIFWAELGSSGDRNCSPLKKVSELALNDLGKSGVDEKIIKSFSDEFTTSGWDKSIEL